MKTVKLTWYNSFSDTLDTEVLTEVERKDAVYTTNGAFMDTYCGQFCPPDATLFEDEMGLFYVSNKHILSKEYLNENQA